MLFGVSLWGILRVRTIVAMSVVEQLGSWPVTNLSAAVVRDGAVVEAFGNQEKLYELASVTKLLTAYGVLVAVTEGAVELDSPCGPEGSTVRHLLAHASGYAFDAERQQKPVGERRIYSSAGYECLARAIGDATGIDFPDYLAEGVFDPLQMETAALTGSAGHGAQASAKDLTRFLEELQNPTVVPQELVTEACRVQFPELRGLVPGYGMQRPCPWGLGFELKGQKSPHWTGASMPATTVGHFGMSGTYLWWVPERKTGMVVLTDRQFGQWAKPLWAEFNNAVWTQLSSA